MSVRRTKSFYYVTQKHTRRLWEGLIATSRQNAWFTQDLTKSPQEIQENGVTADGRKKILGFIPICEGQNNQVKPWDVCYNSQKTTFPRKLMQMSYITCEKTYDGPTVFGMLILLG